MTFAVRQRVYHVTDSHCTGIVINISESGMIGVEWDNVVDYASNPSYWYPDQLRLVSYTTPPPKLEKEPIMSQAIWCDQGGHAFSSKDPGKRHFSETRTVDDGYRVSQVTADMDICGECSEKSFLASTPALTASNQDAVPTQGL